MKSAIEGPVPQNPTFLHVVPKKKEWQAALDHWALHSMLGLGYEIAHKGPIACKDLPKPAAAVQ